MIDAPALRNAVSDALFLTGRLIKHRALAIKRDWTSPALYATAVSAGFVLFSIIFVGSFLGTRVLVASQAYGLIASIPQWAFLVYLITDILIAFGQALGDLYLSRDMPILLAMPLRVPSIITAKFVLGVAQNEVYVCVFLLPFVLGYMLGVAAPLWAYPLALAGVAIFPATLYAGLVVLTVAALRVIPASAAKEALWLIGAAIPTLFWFVSFTKVTRVSGDLTTLRLPPPPDWMPSTWMGNALARLGESALVPALHWMAVLVIVTFVACPLALAIVARGFSRGWSDSVSASGQKKRRSRETIRWPLGRTAALARKDVVVFFRTPALWFNHIAALGFVGYLLVGHAVQTPLLPLTVQLALIQIGFVAVLASINPGMTALSLEHASVWVLKTAPLRPVQILVAKAVVAYGQTAVITSLGALALSVGYGFDAPSTAAVMVFALFMAAASTCAGIAFDSRYPSFSWENPNMINRGVRMVVPFLTGLGVLAACGIVFGVTRVVVGGLAALALGVAIAGALTCFVVAASLRDAARNIAALEV